MQEGREELDFSYECETTRITSLIVSVLSRLTFLEHRHCKDLGIGVRFSIGSFGEWENSTIGKTQRAT